MVLFYREPGDQDVWKARSVRPGLPPGPCQPRQLHDDVRPSGNGDCRQAESVSDGAGTAQSTSAAVHIIEPEGPCT
jgi:hypothetical protein